MRNISLIIFTTSLMACRTDDVKVDDTGDVQIVDNDEDGFLSDVDCDDSNADINPYASEVCDEVDNDCDGLIDDEDEDVSGTSPWYSDADGDGFGDADSLIEACTQPSGLIEDDTDCDDLDYSINPSADEICDTIDNDCDGLVDLDDDSITDASVWYIDSDGDGFGTDDSEQNSCDEPTGGVEIGGDCDDTNTEIHPEADEICDDIDNDCDAFIDEDDDDLTDANTYYTDDDGDGYGNIDAPVDACTQPSTTVEDSS